MKRNFCVQYFRYDGDDIVLWKQVYFEFTPSIQLIMSELTNNNYDSVSISKVK